MVERLFNHDIGGSCLLATTLCCQEILTEEQTNKPQVEP